MASTNCGGQGQVHALSLPTPTAATWLADLPILAGICPLLTGASDKRPTVGENWPDHPGLSIAELEAAAPKCICWHIGAAPGHIAIDIDGPSAAAFCQSHGCDPYTADTWRIIRTGNSERLKLVFTVTPEQKAALAEGGKTVKINGQELAVFAKPGTQIVVLGNHYSKESNYAENDDQYTWAGRVPADAQPLPTEWFELLTGVFCGDRPLRPSTRRTVSTSLARSKRIYSRSSDWNNSSEFLPCPVCGRDHSGACAISRDRDSVWCCHGQTRSAPDCSKAGETVHGHDGRVWAYVRTEDQDPFGERSLFMLHKPRQPGIAAPSPVHKKHQGEPATVKAGKPRKLGHTRAMACFDRCVEVLARRERNSLRRRARLLAIAKALGLGQCINRQDIAQRVLEVKDEHQGNSYTALTAADRLSMDWPDVDWLVPDLLPANDLVIIGGRPKVGKTAFAMAIAAGVLKGQPVAGCEAPRSPRPVILVSDDQGDADTVRAMRQLGINDHQELLWSRRFRLTEQDLDKLLADVAQLSGAVVIIDSLRSVARALPHGENDPEIGAVIYDLKAAVTDAGGSLLLVHHCNKSAGLTGVEALSGHNAIAGAANTVLTLHYVEDEKGKPCKEAAERRLVREGRTGKPLDWVISRTAGTPSFHKVGTYAEWLAQVEEAGKQAKREARQTHTQGEVMEVLAAASGRWLTTREVVEAMGLNWEGRGNGRDPSRVREALNRLAEEDEIQRVRAGTGFTFAAASYGTQLVPDTSTTTAELQRKGSECRDSPRHTSAPNARSMSAEPCRDLPRRRNQLQGNTADPVDVSEADASRNSESSRWNQIEAFERCENPPPLPASGVAGIGSAWDSEPA